MLPISRATSTSTTTTTGAAPAKMRMVSSCNGCRALRKGCSHDCAIRPCLGWIDTPEAQGNATVFLAKFYGRAGLLNLIAAAPDDAQHRPAVFRSMLYEACGRIVNPAFGAVGLLWSGQWEKCVDAVQAVFEGHLNLVAPVDSARAVHANVAAASLAAYDIRHFAKGPDAAAAADLLRFARSSAGSSTRGRKGFKRAAAAAGSSSNASMAKLLKGKGKAPLGQQQEAAEEVEEPAVQMLMELLEHDGGRNEVEAAASDVIQAEAEPPVSMQVLAADHQEAEEVVVGLELTLGFQPVPVVRKQPGSSSGDQAGSSGLRLQLPA